MARPIERRSEMASPTRLYITLASTGYIITSSPIAIGSDTVADPHIVEQRFRLGMSRPRATPTTMTGPIQAGRNR